MALYIKDGVISPKILYYNDSTILNPTDEDYLNAGFVEYIPSEWETVETTSLSLSQLIAKKVEDIKEYDSSNSVNIFYVNGTPTWLDKATRVGLVNSVNAEKNVGRDTTTMWIGNQAFTLDCDDMLEKLNTLELYALECYNVTAQHIAEVNAMERIEDVESFDYRQGYPDKLYFEV